MHQPKHIEAIQLIEAEVKRLQVEIDALRKELANIEQIKIGLMCTHQMLTSLNGGV